VLGARIPIVVPTRYDTMEVRMASCVLASLLMASGSEAAAAKAEATAGANAAAGANATAGANAADAGTRAAA
jgi:hypothetical protein